LFSSALFDSSLYFLTLLNFLLCSSILFLSLLSIFMIITLNSLLGYIVYHHFICCFFWGFILFLTLEHIISPLNFAWFSVLFFCSFNTYLFRQIFYYSCANFSALFFFQKTFYFSP
ncbi:unnamed protein product, partial [Rangifer tarandus platyrhynchus]